jgi:predicted dehydrogenase
VIGAGSFAHRVLVPALRDAGWGLVAIASATGRSAHDASERFGFERALSPEAVIADPDVGLVAVCTRHATHAALAAAALEAGKSVFVEKPPCLDRAELARLRHAEATSLGSLSVGFNRRHAPLARELRRYVLRPGAPFELLVRINAGTLPDGHWLNDLEDGGGRLLGEGCHFVDFACWFAGAIPERVTCTMSRTQGVPLAAAQSYSIVLQFGDGSIATILYGSHGSTRLAKEYVEAHCAERSGALDDFRTLRLMSQRRRRTLRDRTRSKGHVEQFRHLREVLSGAAAPFAPDPLDTMATTFAALESAQTGCAVAPADADEADA